MSGEAGERENGARYDMKLHHALRLPPQELSVVTLVGGGGKTSALFRLADEAVADGRRVVTTTTTQISAAQAEQAPARLLVGLEEVAEGAAGSLAGGTAIDWAALEAKLARHGHCLLAMSVSGPKCQGLPPTVVDELAARAAEFGIRLIAVEGDGSRGRPVKAPAPHEPVIPTCTTHLVPVVGLDGLGLPLAEPYVHRPEQLRTLLQEADASTRLTPRMIARLLVEPYKRGESEEERGERERQWPLAGDQWSVRATGGARLIPLLNKADSAPRLAAARQIAQRLSQQSQPALIGAVGPQSRTAIRERWGVTTAVVLAAGGSRRMGQPKQLLRWQGEPLVTRAARSALQSGATEAIVITGAVNEQVEAALEPLVQEGRGRLRLVFNPNWQEGQAGSVRVAVDALPAGCEAALFLPVDQPRLPAAALRRLWQTWRAGSDLAAVSVAGALRGAPAVFDQRFFSLLKKVQGDRGGGVLLQQHSADVMAIETPGHWLADVDTPEEWQALSP